MTPVIILALSSFLAGVRSRSLLGRTPESPEAGQCGQLTAPWTDTEVTSLSGDWTLMYRLKVLPLSKDGPHRLVFPEQPLFRFIRRVYRCCQMGHRCGGVKGLQGRDTAGQHTGMGNKRLITCSFHHLFPIITFISFHKIREITGLRVNLVNSCSRTNNDFAPFI